VQPEPVANKRPTLATNRDLPTLGSLPTNMMPGRRGRRLQSLPPEGRFAWLAARTIAAISTVPIAKESPTPRPMRPWPHGYRLVANGVCGRDRRTAELRVKKGDRPSRFAKHSRALGPSLADWKTIRNVRSARRGSEWNVSLSREFAARRNLPVMEARWGRELDRTGMDQNREAYRLTAERYGSRKRRAHARTAAS
jgi:hypothetical protein